MSPRIGIIGVGHVGRHTQEILHPHVVVTFDSAEDEAYPYDDLASCDVVVICVDTPPMADGRADITNVVEAVMRVPADLVVLRSTVPPGTVDSLSERTGKSICFMPEYVGESNFAGSRWEASGLATAFAVIGGAPAVRRRAIELLVPVYGPSTVFFQCEAREAEIIKYMENAFFATKLMFVNQFFDLCQGLGADWATVREGWLLDPRVGRDHSAVFAEDRGFGGRCLPKDLSALLARATDAGVALPLLEAVAALNDSYRQ